MSFPEFFERATGNPPYPYQIRMAEAGWPEVLRVPTGAGKTAAVILSWLYRREAQQQGATRLVFCLPMRVLVSQTLDNVRIWLEKLGLQERYKVYELMGGSVEENWERNPAEPCILVGTQDMLLSRALNRGYAMSRYRWSVPFGLLHNDAQWVFDEVQLMGVARATSVQLQAFRDRETTYGVNRSLWMSATLQADWLATVDRPAPAQTYDLDDSDLAYRTLATRMNAPKQLRKADLQLTKESKKDYPRQLAELAWQQHQPETLTLVIVNRVDRAVDTYRALQKLNKGLSDGPDLLLLHSRFRPGDRSRKEKLLEAYQKKVPPQGVIVVSTQVVEAGVDLSARALLTELCPYSSMVQRLGRCNRDGKEPAGGSVEWIDLVDDLLPYEDAQLAYCRSMLAQLDDVSPAALRRLGGLQDESESELVLRHKDLLELFETTSDLAGEDVDVSRYIREPNMHDAQVFWRTCDSEEWTRHEGLPKREELCSVSVSQLKTYIGSERQAYRWNYGEERWEAVDRPRIRPGQVYLLKSSSGGYDSELGFGRDYRQPVSQVADSGEAPRYDRDHLGQQRLTLEEHTLNVLHEMQAVLGQLQVADLPTEQLIDACLWHDVGKAHEVFQRTMYQLQDEQVPLPALLLGKSGAKGGRHQRRGFRHEFASALAALQYRMDPLVVFLAAVHHGKLRFSVRPLPQEQIRGQQSGDVLIRGVRSGDRLPPLQLGSLQLAQETVLDLNVLNLGHETGWVRTLWSLVPQYGVFKLAFLEALIRCADTVASQKENERQVVSQR